MTDPTRDELLALYRGRPDLTAKQIAAQFGFSTAKLYQLLSTYGVELGRKRQPDLLKRPDINAVAYKHWYHNPGRTQAEIAAHFKISVSAVHRVAKRRGLATRQELEDQGILTFPRSSTQGRKNWDCDTCPHCPTCDPKADQLPCEAGPTPYARPEISELPSPNGGITMVLPLMWEDED